MGKRELPVLIKFYFLRKKSIKEMHPALAWGDYVLFPNLRTCLGGKRFGSNEEVIIETNAYSSETSRN